MGRLTPICCAYCGKQTLKQAGHINRAKKIGAAIYCDRKCFGMGRRSRTPEERAEYMQKYREAHREDARQYARNQRRGDQRDKILAAQRASYMRNRDMNLARMKDYRERTRPERIAQIKRWLKDNPDKAQLYNAKRLIAEATGLRIRDVPTDLAEARAVLMEINRWVRDARDSGSDPEGEDKEAVQCRD